MNWKIWFDCDGRLRELMKYKRLLRNSECVRDQFLQESVVWKNECGRERKKRKQNVDCRKGKYESHWKRQLSNEYKERRCKSYLEQSR